MTRQEEPLRIMVTNDDGIDSMGLLALAQALVPLGQVTIIAPDQEFSGAGAAIGAIWENMPEVHEAHVEGFENCWSVSGAPALCVLYARLGAFGPPPDFVVSGINPGANVGRAVYHSGTVGAALTARNGGIPSVAVSQSAHNTGVEGQAWGEVVAQLHWETAATIAASAVKSLIVNPAPDAGVLNINVPDLPISEIESWEWTEIGNAPPRTMTAVELTPKPGHTGSFSVGFAYGEALAQVPGTDTAAILEDKVSLSWLSRIGSLDPNFEGTPADDEQVASPSDTVGQALGDLLA